jgi:hypothetical protein
MVVSCKAIVSDDMGDACGWVRCAAKSLLSVFSVSRISILI